MTSALAVSKEYLATHTASSVQLFDLKPLVLLEPFSLFFTACPELVSVLETFDKSLDKLYREWQGKFYNTYKL